MFTMLLLCKGIVKMEELSELIQRVTEKSKKMKAELVMKTDALTQLQIELQNITSQKAEFEQRVKELEKELAQAKEIRVVSNQEIDLNERIDELVREIDDCIHHLKQ